MMLPSNTEEIPANYASEDWEPNDLNTPTTVSGERAYLQDSLDGQSALPKFEVSVIDNQVAASAFAEAQRRYDKLSNDEKKKTSPSSMAIDLFAEMKRNVDAKASANRAIVTPVEVESEPQESVMLTSTAQESKEAEEIKDLLKKRQTKKKKTVKKRRVKPAAKRSAKKANIEVRQQKATEAPSDPFSGLSIPQLGAEPVQADLVADISWSASDGGSQAREVWANWAIVDKTSRGIVTQLALIRDLRNEPDEIEPIPFEDNATMSVQVYPRTEDGFGTAEVEFTAIRGAFSVTFGIFEIIILLPTGE